MRIWNLVISVSVLALGLTAWRYGDWQGSEEFDGCDGACQGLYQLCCYLVALGLFALSIALLFLRGRHLRSAIQDFMSSDEVSTKTGEVTRPGKRYDSVFD